MATVGVKWLTKSQYRGDVIMNTQQ